MSAWLQHAWRRVTDRGAGPTASGPGPSAEATNSRWVVIDVETSGLQPGRDRLLSIGAVAVHGRRLVAADSFECVVRQEQASERANILVHGIGDDAQRSGVELVEACSAFLAYLRDSPLVAFHAAFDRAFVQRAMRRAGLHCDAAWLDLAALAPVVQPVPGARALDDWLAHFQIDVSARHDAGSDAFATAMLFLRLLASVPERERTPRGLARLAAQARWLPR